MSAPGQRARLGDALAVADDLDCTRFMLNSDLPDRESDTAIAADVIRVVADGGLDDCAVRGEPTDVHHDLVILWPEVPRLAGLGAVDVWGVEKCFGDELSNLIGRLICRLSTVVKLFHLTSPYYSVSCPDNHCYISNMTLGQF